MGFVYRFVVITLVVSSWAGCQDVETFIPGPLSSSFSASVFVEVTDPAGDPVADARVVLGNRVGYTNADGVLFLRHVPMTDATYAQIDKEGYFHGSRRFYPSAGRIHHISIQLTPHRVAGGFTASAGGTIYLDSKTTLVFPADGISDAQGRPYAGYVQVLAYPIHADDPALSDRMPGDLVGRTADGALEALASLGMIAVELVGDAGQTLQVTSGSTVNMRMVIPTAMSATAPATIPMWFFDEQDGVWKEEGLAVRDGDSYSADVAHFTYWNYDVPFPLVKWGATFVYEDGTPVSQLSVCITIPALEATKCAYTDAGGLVCGLVAAGEPLRMEVRDACDNVVYVQDIGPFTEETLLGPITLPNSLVHPVAISGLAVNCEDAPVTDGYARIRTGNKVHYIALNETDGSFAATLINCDESDVSVRVTDQEALRESLLYTFPNAPAIDAGTITVCDQIAEFIDLEVVGFPDHFVFYYPEMETDGTNTTFYTVDSTANLQYFFLIFPGVTAGDYTAEITEIGMELPTGEFYYVQEPPVITVTHYGGPGEMIQGTISATVVPGQGSTGSPYPLVGSFSIRYE